MERLSRALKPTSVEKQPINGTLMHVYKPRAGVVKAEGSGLEYYPNDA